MKLVKYIFILVVLIFVGYSSAWYYISHRITSEINTKYTSKKFDIKGLNDEEFLVSFEDAKASGFPFEMAVKLTGWTEESKGALISYKSPLNIGYNIISQNFYISYDGEIDAAYKPVANNFGAILKIKNYLVKIPFSLSKSLFTTIKNMKDPIELVNYISDIKISTNEVQIFDKQENELFYDKEHEQLIFSFVKSKYYENIDDFLQNIPKEYNFSYLVKTKATKFSQRRIAASLFYIFSMIPSEVNAKALVNVKTQSKTFQELSKNLEIHGDCSIFAPKIDIPSLKINFTGDMNILKGSNSKFLLDGKIRLKAGIFDDLFTKYQSISQAVVSVPGGHILNQEMSYIISNKEAFKFKDLENSDYIVNVDINSFHNKATSEVNIKDFSIYSGDSGFKLTNQSLIKNNSSNWHKQGVLLIKNYPVVVEFTSGYIYRFGEFRFLNDQARDLYVSVNKDFLKQISDHPNSTSNDLSFEYELDSNNIIDGRIGSTKITKIIELYQLMLYKKLFGMIDTKGDILNQIKKILPNLDENDPMLKTILPMINGKNLNQENQDVPTNSKDTIQKVLPIKKLKEKIGKDLLKNLVK